MNKSLSIALANKEKAITPALLLVSVLFLVWPLDHVVAVRNVLILALFGWTAMVVRPIGREALSGSMRYFGALLLLTLWLLLHTAFITPEPRAAWGELGGQWFKALLVLITGFGLGKVLSQGREKGQIQAVIRVILLATLIFGLFIVGKAIYLFYLNHGHFTVADQLGRDRASFSLSIGVAIVATDVIHRLMKREALIPWGQSTVIGVAGFLIVAMFLAGARNGLIGMFFLLSSAAVMWFSAHPAKHKALLRLISFFVLMLLLIFLAIKADPRWQKFMDTVPIALDTEHYRAWLTRVDYPHLPGGDLVDASAYERIAWMKMGVEMAFHYPLGYGYERWVFGQALLPIYHGTAGGHSHSGYIDLTLSAGFPGLFLWLFFVVSLVSFAISTYKKTHSPLALLLLFLVLSFNGRMVLDSVWRDHYLQTHFFVIALLAAYLHKMHAAVSNEPEQAERG